jgi:hypothetical protein
MDIFGGLEYDTADAAVGGDAVAVASAAGGSPLSLTLPAGPTWPPMYPQPPPPPPPPPPPRGPPPPKSSRQAGIITTPVG